MRASVTINRDFSCISAIGAGTSVSQWMPSPVARELLAACTSFAIIAIYFVALS
jgi:hypothetical protein